MKKRILCGATVIMIIAVLPALKCFLDGRSAGGGSSPGSVTIKTSPSEIMQHDPIPELEVRAQISDFNIYPCSVYADNSATCRVDNVPAGSNAFTVTYYSTDFETDLKLLESSTSAEVVAEQNTNVNISFFDKRMDYDSDGVTNLHEVVYSGDPVDSAVKPPYKCLNGIDDDNDTFIDWPDDPECSGPTGTAESLRAVTAGGNHTCALTNADAAKCWGWNSDGQLGNGEWGTTSLKPADVSGLSDGISAIAAGACHTCALTLSGAVKCWGDNGFAQLGIGSSRSKRLTPADVSGLSSGVKAITAGRQHTCALTVAGGVKCWGYNSDGRLGDGASTKRKTPVSVSGLSGGVVAVSAGKFHTCALTDDGGVKCWGRNDHGQLGNGQNCGETCEDLMDGKIHCCTVPTEVSGLSRGVKAITAGWQHTCAVTDSGKVKCWGSNNYGQLGDCASETDHLLPEKVSGVSGRVVGIVAGKQHTCVMMKAGAVKCWGKNEDGQLGDGASGKNRCIPTDVSGLPGGASAIAAGWRHTCALTDAGGVKCWGDNNYGQLGDGSFGTDRLEPADVVWQ